MKSYLILEKDFEQRIPYRIAAISILIQRNSVILNVWRIVYIVSTNVSPDLSLSSDGGGWGSSGFEEVSGREKVTFLVVSNKFRTIKES